MQTSFAIIGFVLLFILICVVIALINNSCKRDHQLKKLEESIKKLKSDVEKLKSDVEKLQNRVGKPFYEATMWHSSSPATGLFKQFEDLEKFLKVKYVGSTTVEPRYISTKKSK